MGTIPISNKDNEPEYDIPVMPSPGTRRIEPNKQANNDRIK